MFDGWRSNNNSILGHIIEIPFQGFSLFPSGLIKYKIFTNYQPNKFFLLFVYAAFSLLS